MSKELEKLRADYEKAQQELEVWKNREQRAQQKLKYQRSAKDRKRTHHLIQCGAAFESHHKELSILTDEEVFLLVESLLDIPDVRLRIKQVVDCHKEGSD
ncbi:MAG: DUF3847 domain-containing protein [Lachnospiraceae bacterium]|nr:DUF3847 domain-containing protein [Lachnospiraceae bacterium]